MYLKLHLNLKKKGYDRQRVIGHLLKLFHGILDVVVLIAHQWQKQSVLSKQELASARIFKKGENMMKLMASTNKIHVQVIN